MVDILHFRGDSIERWSVYRHTRSGLLHVPRNQMGEDRERLVGITRCALMAAVLSAITGCHPTSHLPVPFTLQSVGVYVAAGLLGPRWGTVLWPSTF